MCPAMHLQSPTAVLAKDELVPGGHAEHVPAPVPALYSPPSHAMHSTPSEPAVCPAMHLQSPTAVLAKDELVPAGQLEHAPAPVTDLYCKGFGVRS